MIAPVLPYEIQVTELHGGDRFTVVGGLLGSCQSGDHALPVLAYRVDLVRGRAFLPDRARALGVPIDLWSQLQVGEPVSWNGGSAIPDAVLGPPRPGSPLAYVTDTRPAPNLPQFLKGVDLLVCEGTYGSDEDLPKAVRNRHMTFREAAALPGCQRQPPLDHALQPGARRPGWSCGERNGVFPQARIGHDGVTIGLSFPDG